MTFFTPKLQILVDFVSNHLPFSCFEGVESPFHPDPSPVGDLFSAGTLSRGCGTAPSQSCWTLRRGGRGEANASHGDARPHRNDERGRGERPLRGLSPRPSEEWRWGRASPSPGKRPSWAKRREGRSPRLLPPWKRPAGPEGLFDWKLRSNLGYKMAGWLAIGWLILVLIDFFEVAFRAFKLIKMTTLKPPPLTPLFWPNPPTKSPLSRPFLVKFNL